jgi:peroxidase
VSPKNIERLKSAYQSVEDIDLFIGMAAEEPENALVGNTYRCLIADQFARLKKGDRYFYDLKEQSGSFTAGTIYLKVINVIILVKLFFFSV